MTDHGGERSGRGGECRANAPPPGLRRIEGTSAWHGEQLAREPLWMHRFEECEVRELLEAVGRVRDRGLRLEEVARSEFELPVLGPRLDRVRRELINGRGFVLLRGFPADRVSREDAACAFWGISRHLGTPVPQNAEGHLIGHVTDLGADMSDPNARVYATNRFHRFHTDSADLVGLLCLQTAKQGGVSSLVSSVSIYNELVRSRPELAETLFQPFPVARKGEIPAGQKAFYMMPVFHWYDGLLTAIFSRDFIEASQHYRDAPRLTTRQIEAMDALERLAADPALRLDMELDRGDMQFLHNHQILHSRSAYEDHPQAERKRHLLRIWLCPPDGRRLPPVFAKRYGSVEIGRRGGIRLPGVSPSVPLSTVPRPWWMHETA